MKLFDENRGDFLEIAGVCWAYRDIINEKYDGIVEIKGTGFQGERYSRATERYSNEEIHEYDILSVHLKSSRYEQVEGYVKWHAPTAQFLFERFDNGQTVWMNGLYDVVIIGSTLTR